MKRIPFKPEIFNDDIICVVVFDWEMICFVNPDVSMANVRNTGGMTHVERIVYLYISAFSEPSNGFCPDIYFRISCKELQSVLGIDAKIISEAISKLINMGRMKTTFDLFENEGTAFCSI